jgi:hypothetical protein
MYIDFIDSSKLISITGLLFLFKFGPWDLIREFYYDYKRIDLQSRGWVLFSDTALNAAKAKGYDIDYARVRYVCILIYLINFSYWLNKYLGE